MKKILLFLIFSIFVSAHAASFEGVEFNGEIDMSFEVMDLPTGERGNSAVRVPSIFLDVDVPLVEGNAFHFRFEGSEQTETSAERFRLGVREAHLDLVSPFAGLHGLRIGLLPQPWHEAQYQSYSYRFVAPTGWAITEKWNYLGVSDLGASFMSELPQNWGEWALTLTNGAGRTEEENSPHKDFAILLRLKSMSWILTLNYLRGQYDQYGVELGTKERIQALLTYQNADQLLIGLEYLGARDPADAITALEIAEGVDVTALAGQVVRGWGASLFAVQATGPRAEVLVRYDYLNPAQGQNGKELQTALIALGYKVQPDLRSAISYDYTQYGKDFAPGKRTLSRIQLSAQVQF